MVNIASFALLAVFMMGVMAAAFPLLGHLLAISAASAAGFKTYLFYLLENVISVVVTTETIRAHFNHAPEKASETR